MHRKDDDTKNRLNIALLGTRLTSIVRVILDTGSLFSVVGRDEVLER